MNKVCRLLADGTVEWRQFADPREADQRVASWWAEKSTHAVVNFRPNGSEDARYERPGFVEALTPDKWPRRVKRPGAEPPPREATPEPMADEPAVPMFDDGKPPDVAPARMHLDTLHPAAPAAGNVCGCCLQRPGLDGDEPKRDRTPSGRIAAHRCPLCGAPWPTAAGGPAILRRYLSATAGTGPRAVNTGRTAHAKLRGLPK